MSEADVWRIVAIMGLVAFLIESALCGVMLKLLKSQHKLNEEQNALVRELLDEDPRP